jgi:hypothetical protein
MRNLIVLLVLAAFVCFASSCFAQTSLQPTDDTQFWSDIQVTVKVAKDKKEREFVSLLFGGTLRVGRNITHPVDERGAVGIDFNLRNLSKNFNLKLTPGYLYQAAQPFKGRKTYEHRLVFGATPEYTLNQFKFKDRNQFERRLRNSGIDSTRYRNRFEIEYSVKREKSELLRAFTADEVFYDWSVTDWVRNRFTIGCRKDLDKDKHFMVEVYYLRQNDARARPGDLHVIGTLLKITLN